MEVGFKRCLLRVQKGVNKGLKGHLLQVKRALVASRLVVFIKLVCEKKADKGGRWFGFKYGDCEKENEFGNHAEPIIIKVYLKKTESSGTFT